MDGRARVAWNLRRVRVARDISQENLAFDADVDRTTISGIERGNFNPSLDLLDRLAAALAVDLVDLFAVPDTKRPTLQGLKPGPRPGSKR